MPTRIVYKMMLFLNQTSHRVLRNCLTKTVSIRIHSASVLRTISIQSCYPIQDSLQLYARHPAYLPFQYRLCSSSKSSSGSSKRTEEENVEDDNEKAAMSLDEELSQLGFYQRYKKLFVEYWYVLVPCHGLTSILWFGSLFLLAKSGAIDLVKLLEAFSVPDVIVKPLRNPNLGSLAVAAAMYKVVSPARYLSTVTITVPLIKALVRRGKIKPVPKKGEIKKMMQDQRKIIEDKIQRK